ncbi:hypothetical protein [Methanobacterium sp.]|nr:hypothetical protein [Methanobacterium sp.]MDY9923398.1 hypothetical protein [Methanobacterium sp.]
MILQVASNLQKVSHCHFHDTGRLGIIFDDVFGKVAPHFITRKWRNL